ncbi:2539_t:CDS:2 [Acaulospora colombiana]|uniref:2539_t:CDS:1 n=1 Tax=Acaulospora colombiana TaxID=27376 RepID=A0ACA9L1U3_9GLOM|nr:2539_t:CDS:2 [Acaulospora colombiana]
MKGSKKSKFNNVNRQTNGDNESSEIDEIFMLAKNKKENSNSLPIQEAKSKETTPSSATKSSDLSDSTVSSNRNSEPNEKGKSKSSKVEEFVFKVPAIPDRLKSNKRKLKQNDDDGFGDSRGTKNRKKTEDGFAIYDVSELNIGNGGGIGVLHHSLSSLSSY